MNTIKKHRKPLRLGVPVHGKDGEIGKVSRIVIDSDCHQPTYLVIKTGRLRFRREVVVPVSLIASVEPETVQLDMTKEALAGFPDYEVTVIKGKYNRPLVIGMMNSIPLYYPPDNSGFMVLRQRSVPDDSVAVKKGMAIRDRTGQRIGSVAGVILDQETRKGKFVVIQRDRFSPIQLIAAELVQGVTSEDITLRIDKNLIANLPEYTKESFRADQEAFA